MHVLEVQLHHTAAVHLLLSNPVFDSTGALQPGSNFEAPEFFTESMRMIESSIKIRGGGGGGTTFQQLCTQVRDDRVHAIVTFPAGSKPNGHGLLVKRGGSRRWYTRRCKKPAMHSFVHCIMWQDAGSLEMDTRSQSVRPDGLNRGALQVQSTRELDQNY